MSCSTASSAFARSHQRPGAHGEETLRGHPPRRAQRALDIGYGLRRHDPVPRRARRPRRHRGRNRRGAALHRDRACRGGRSRHADRASSSPTCRRRSSRPARRPGSSGRGRPPEASLCLEPQDNSRGTTRSNGTDAPAARDSTDAPVLAAAATASMTHRKAAPAGPREVQGSPPIPRRPAGGELAFSVAHPGRTRCQARPARRGKDGRIERSEPGRHYPEMLSGVWMPGNPHWRSPSERLARTPGPRRPG